MGRYTKWKASGDKPDKISKKQCLRKGGSWIKGYISSKTGKRISGRCRL